MIKEITLNSGKVLKVDLCEFEIGKDLFQAVMEEIKALKMDENASIDVNFYKDLFCAYISSKRIESCVWRCFDKVIYDNMKVNKDLFNTNLQAREDYLDIVWEVAKENLAPFTKNLYAQFSRIQGEMNKLSQA
jgi:hypothetical protein